MATGSQKEMMKMNQPIDSKWGFTHFNWFTLIYLFLKQPQDKEHFITELLDFGTI